MTIQTFKTEFYSDDTRLSPASALTRLGVAVAAAARGVQLWFVRAEGRRALRHLDPHLLRDIGMTRAQALREAGKPFWEK